MTKCPSPNGLIDFLRGRLSPAEHAEIETHLSLGCRQCEEEQSWLAETLEVSTSDNSFEFSEEVIGRVVDHFKTHGPQKQSLFGRLQAQLVFDSLLMQPQMGLRSDFLAQESPSERQVLFQADQYHVDLRFELVEVTGVEIDFEDLIGQILRKQDTQTPLTFAVRLCQGERELAHVQTDARGLFRFGRIPSGIYDLRISVPEGEVCVDRVATARAS